MINKKINKKFISTIYLSLALLFTSISYLYGMSDMTQTQGAFTIDAYEAMKRSYTTQELELLDAVFEKLIQMIVILDIEYEKNTENKIPATKVDWRKIPFLFIDKDYKQDSYTLGKTDIMHQEIPRDLRFFYGIHEQPISDLNPINYLRRMQIYLKCSSSCYVIALKYIEKFINKVDDLVHKKGGSNIFNHVSFHRIFLAAITIAIKSFDDRRLTNVYYAQIGGVRAEELWMLELQFVMIMKLDLHVSKEEFDNLCSTLVTKDERKSRGATPGPSSLSYVIYP